MDLSNLTYSKKNINIKKEKHKESTYIISTTNTQQDINSNNFKITPSYRKIEGTLPTSLIFVLSGGEKKEKDFLKELIKENKFHSVRVAFESKKKQGLQPNQMEKRWNEIKTTKLFKIDSQTYLLDTTDKIFLLSDVDEYYDQLTEILKNFTDNQECKWIISNPCFEIWLYYCYLNNPHKDLEILESLTTKQRSKKLKALGPTLVKGGLNPCKAFEKMAIGIANSEPYFALDDKQIPLLYATQMHEMAEYIIAKMNSDNNEYEQYLIQKKIEENEWRNKIKQ